MAIIGCGVGGLSAIKSCLDAGIRPTCFEQQSSFGGIWNYTDEVRPNLGSVHRNTISNLSKAIMCFSDFPIPKEWPNFLPHRMFMKYLEMYAKTFGLEQYVKLNTKVDRLAKTDDHKVTGRWSIRYTRYIYNCSLYMNFFIPKIISKLSFCQRKNYSRGKSKMTWSNNIAKPIKLS